MDRRCRGTPRRCRDRRSPPVDRGAAPCRGHRRRAGRDHPGQPWGL